MDLTDLTGRLQFGRMAYHECRIHSRQLQHNNTRGGQVRGDGTRTEAMSQLGTHRLKFLARPPGPDFVAGVAVDPYRYMFSGNLFLPRSCVCARGAHAGQVDRSRPHFTAGV